MNYHILEMLYSIPELHELSYRFYQQMPNRVEAEQDLKQIWAECTAASSPDMYALLLRLEDAMNYTGALQERAAFSTGLHLGWGLARMLGI